MTLKAFFEAIVRVVALGLALLALRWLWLFSLTDYRHYFAPTMIVLSVIVGLWAILLWRMSRVALILSAVGASVVVFYAGVILFRGLPSWNFALMAMAIGAAAYGGVAASLIRMRRPPITH